MNNADNLTAPQNLMRGDSIPTTETGQGENERKSGFLDGMRSKTMSAVFSAIAVYGIWDMPKASADGATFNNKGFQQNMRNDRRESQEERRSDQNELAALIAANNETCREIYTLLAEDADGFTQSDRMEYKSAKCN